ncbi:class I SAM-dependent methyltransferase [Stakelama marina]|uniref:Methyltransferase domain-containing protein n=1 Tax=Stakelama marina TaxID=2826939 RepID=A0A8T4II79_9SPHN|nr:class I SAM-dependent methyltransferase [Stakelama marina]MBR0553584.1 methyltransferase domain-containing protein [Stakelama marina]
MTDTVAGHAGHMDAIYRTQRHFYDLTRKYYLLGRDALIADLAPPPGGTVLEIGCGTARNAITAARRWPDARFFGYDISEAMLETARTNLKRAGLEGRVHLARGDAMFDEGASLFGCDAFDRVFMSYTLSMIPDWQAAIRLAAKSVAAGGALHIVDFGQQEHLPGWFRAGLFAWLAKFDVTPRRALPVVLEQVAADEDMLLDFRAPYRGYAWAATLKRRTA